MESLSPRGKATAGEGARGKPGRALGAKARIYLVLIPRLQDTAKRCRSRAVASRWHSCHWAKLEPVRRPSLGLGWKRAWWPQTVMLRKEGSR